jgi:hypothetical protein
MANLNIGGVPPNLLASSVLTSSELAFVQNLSSRSNYNANNVVILNSANGGLPGKFLRVKLDGSGLEWADAGAGTVGGSISTGQVAFGTGANTIGGDINLTWDNTAKKLITNALKIGTLSGVLKATSGDISGGATTDDLPEGTTNLYFTQARARNSISGDAPITYNSSTGVIGLDTSGLVLKSGTPSAGQLAYFIDGNSVGVDDNLNWDSNNRILKLGINYDTGGFINIIPDYSFSAVFYYNGTSYTNNTTEALLYWGTPFTILASTSDYFYVGKSFKFNSIAFYLAQNGSNITLAAEYWNGTTWAPLTITDGTNNLQYQGTITFTPPSDWQQTTVNGATYYYVRLKTTTTPSVVPTAYLVKISLRPALIAYNTPSLSYPDLIVDAVTGVVSIGNIGNYTVRLNVRKAAKEASGDLLLLDTRGVDVGNNTVGIIFKNNTGDLSTYPDVAIRSVQVGSYASDLVFYTRTSNSNISGLTERLRIKQTGEVGIGMSPSEKLDVSGNIRASGNVIGHIAINQQTGTSYTLTLSDDGKLIQMNNASANTLTIPANSSVAFPIGTKIMVQKYGTGDTTIQGAAGVTVRDPNSLATITVQYDTRVIMKIGTNEWVII